MRSPVFAAAFSTWVMAHQSNGRGEDLSRSWNRVYAQFGFERGNLALMIRPWYRIPENAETDDNPDIEDYLGHGDLLAVYRQGRNVYSLLLRNNFKKSDNHGAVKLNWSFPLYGRLKGYVQYFNGYGESLIDYNHSQQSLRAGRQPDRRHVGADGRGDWMPGGNSWSSQSQRA
jgi:phospholipase A1/A2